LTQLTVNTVKLYWPSNIISKDQSSESSDIPPSELCHLHPDSNSPISAQARIKILPHELYPDIISYVLLHIRIQTQQNAGLGCIQ